jgi:hypothetical protein
MPDPISFLQAVSGFTRHEDEASSANRPVRFAVIDPAFVSSGFPGTLPKVTFEGESTLSGKRYAVLSGYLPQPSDKVVLMPAGTTYLILGSVDGDTAGYHGDGHVQGDRCFWTAYSTVNDTFIGTTYAPGTVCGTTFVAGPSGSVLVILTGIAGNNSVTLGTNTYISFEVRAGAVVGAGAVALAASDDRSIRSLVPTTTAGFKYDGGARLHPHGGLTPGSTYNVQAMSRVTAGTGAHLNRAISVMQLSGPVT